MRKGQDAQKYARPIAEFVGLTIENGIGRYSVMSLSFLFLAVAAYLFGPAAPLEAVGALGLAYALIFFTIYWWFLEEARKRRIMLGTEQPRAHDSANPDLRDEVIFACAVMLILTPLLLQTLNASNLHYAVAPDSLGLKALACAGAQPDSFCAHNTRLFELPAWLFFTVQSFATTLPIVDQLGDWAASMTGVHATATTPPGVAIALRLVFGGFLLTFVAGMFTKVGRQLDAAIDALTLSHQLAAGMGPIILGKLQKVIAQDEKNVIVWQNAVIAVGEIAQNYPGAREEIQRLFAEDFKERFFDIPTKTKDLNELNRLTVIAGAFCSMRSGTGLEAVRHRIAQSNDFVRTRCHLVSTLVSALDSSEAIDQLQQMPTQRLRPQLTNHINRALTELSSVPTDDGDSGDGNTAQAAAGDSEPMPASVAAAPAHERLKAQQLEQPQAA